MNLYIPAIGDAIVLSEDWTFPIINETRNSGMFKLRFPTEDIPLSYGRWCRAPEIKREITLTAGTTLVIDRVYLAKGNSDFHSITFVIRKDDPKVGNKRQVRFWVKLRDANRIVCEKT